MNALHYLIYKRNHGSLLEKTIAQRELAHLGISKSQFELMDKQAMLDFQTGKVHRIPMKYELKVTTAADHTRAPGKFAPERASSYSKIPAVNYYKKEMSKPMNTLEKVSLGVGSFGFAWGAKTVLLESLEGSGELCVAAGKYLSFCKGVNAVAGGVGLAYSIYGIFNDEQGFKKHLIADIAIGIAGFALTGGTAYIVGGTYFITDLGVQYYTGKSITENLFD